MTALAYQQASINGLVPTLVAAANGDTVPPDDHGCLLVKNGSGAGITVTVVVPGNGLGGVAVPDVTTASIGAGLVGLVGPLNTQLMDPTTGTVSVTYSSITTITVAAVRV